MEKDVVKGLIDCIEYFIENSACDLCGKCAFYTPPKKEEDYTPCKAFEEKGNRACRDGIIEYFQTEAVNGKQAD